MNTELIKDFRPPPALSKYVRKYQVFRFLYTKESVVPVKYHTPHPEHCITFYVRDIQRYSFLDAPAVFTYPRCVVNGIYTVPLNRHGGYDFLAIKVVLQPGVLFCLTGFQAHELTDTFLDAEALWGKEIRLVCQRLTSAGDLPEMFLILEKFLAHLFTFRLCRNLHSVDKATRFILDGAQIASMEWLASQSCLSTRQFIRKFEERSGIRPKQFACMVRFDQAYRMKNADPSQDWLSIALACGYYDYQHLVKDYKEFTNHTPQSLFDLERKVPQRRFSTYEC